MPEISQENTNLRAVAITSRMAIDNSPCTDIGSDDKKSVSNPSGILFPHPLRAPDMALASEVFASTYIRCPSLSTSSLLGT